MYDATVLLLLLIALIGLFYGVLRSLLRAWVGRRARIALLEMLEGHPEPRPAPNVLDAFLAGGGPLSEQPKGQDYAVTGLLLAVIGGACVVLGLALKVGQFAVGTFVGGVLCIWLGLFAGVAGWVARAMARRAKPKG